MNLTEEIFSKRPAQPQGPPEESDFRGVTGTNLKLKSPRHGSELIKYMIHTFGASLAGIYRLHEEWVTQVFLGGVGRTEFDVAAHWKHSVVITVPNEWDSLYANPTYGTSYDAYSMLRFMAGKLEVFIRKKGCSSRYLFPPT